jgi:hypothetical protein
MDAILPDHPRVRVSKTQRNRTAICARQWCSLGKTVHGWAGLKAPVQQGEGMSVNCSVCGKEIVPSGKAKAGNITPGICERCAVTASGTAGNSLLLESIEAPVLLMQKNPK